MEHTWKASNGSYLLRPIFFELDTADKPYAVYSLKDYDHVVNGKVYPSLRLLYLSCRDLTEYTFAKTYLGGWGHWKRLREANWFQEFYTEWREELEVMMKSAALASVYTKAQNPDDKENLSAAKFLLTDGWKDKEKVGPRTKEKIKAEADRIFKSTSEIHEDFDRILGDAGTIN